MGTAAPRQAEFQGALIEICYALYDLMLSCSNLNDKYPGLLVDSTAELKGRIFQIEDILEDSEFDAEKISKINYKLKAFVST
jgi:hypothetical protein